MPNGGRQYQKLEKGPLEMELKKSRLNCTVWDREEVVVVVLEFGGQPRGAGFAGNREKESESL